MYITSVEKKIARETEVEFSKIIFLAKYVHYEVLNTKYFFEIFPAFLLFKIGS